jgi:serine/threonine-protein kinase
LAFDFDVRPNGTTLAVSIAESTTRITMPASTTPISSVRHPWLPCGSIVGGRYRIDEWISGGGMGIVYRATQLDTGRSVALKQLQPRLQDNAGAKTRFLREARLLGRFRGTHLPRLLDVGEADGLLYVALELLGGPDLRRVLNHGPIAPEQVKSITLQLCEALQEVHAENVVHRDIKPENVVLTECPGPHPKVKLIDFGIAKELKFGPRPLHPRAHTIGSPKYMAPEQEQTAHAVDHRAYIWSLGALIFEMLTGSTPPRPDETPEPYGPPIPLVSAEFEALVHRCLAPNPADRFQCVRHLELELQRLDTLLPELVSYTSNSGSQRVTKSSGIYRRSRPASHAETISDRVATLNVVDPAG